MHNSNHLINNHVKVQLKYVSDNLYFLDNHV